MLLLTLAGRHNEFVGNIINGSGGIIHLDDRGGGGNGCAHAGRMPYSFLERVPYNCTSCPWSKYPGLAGPVLRSYPLEAFSVI